MLSAMTWLLIKLVVRLVVFAGVFALAAWKVEKVEIKPRYAIPLVGLVFAILNTGLYWLLRPVLAIATLGMVGFLIPFVLNGAFLYATDRVLKPLRIEGLWTTVKLAVILTATHGLLWVGLDLAPTWF
jgi:uncharacterized membrane protein YvlD (DUF360 family)